MDIINSSHVMLHVGLRGALRKAAENNPLYETLWACFIITSKESAERLNVSVASFPQYTRHDIKHAENVVTKMEMLIGEKRITQLEPTDIWLLLMCAYTHDWGMTVSLADMQEHFDRLEAHIDELREKHQGSYSRAAHELDINNLKKYVKNNKNVDNDILNALNSQRNLMLILQSYFRTFHSEGYGRSMDLRTYTGIDRRLRALVNVINKTHTGAWKDVMSLERVTDGYAADTAHPRFVSVMLRMADLMDIDSGRVNPFQVRLIENSGESQAHQEKHLAVEYVLTTPEKISAHFDFDIGSITKNTDEYGEGALQSTFNKMKSKDRATTIRNEAARLAFAWYDMLKEEAKNFSLAWHNIVPENYTGSAPMVDDEDFTVAFNGTVIKAEDLDLRYILSYTRAFEIIQGAGLYRDPLTFIRELVQNAMDAQKIQLFLDWEYKNGMVKDKNDITINQFFKELPYDLKEAAVQVELHVYGDSEGAILRVKDFGTGISREKLRKLRYIGNIYDAETEKTKKRMPEWLKPTGSFGIGLQSVFDFLRSSDIVDSNFTIHTRSAQTDESLRITFHSNQSGGEIFYEECHGMEKRQRNGTDVEVPLTNQLDKLISNFNISGTDAFSNKWIRIAHEFKNYLSRTVNGDIIPLVFYIEHDLIKTIDNRMNYNNQKKYQPLIDNVYKNAFPYLFDTYMEYKYEYENNFSNNLFKNNINSEWGPTGFTHFYPIVTGEEKNEQLAFWQWNPQRYILIYVSLSSRVKEIDNEPYRLLNKQLFGKAMFSFRGISIRPGSDKNSEQYEWKKMNTPWCDAKIYVMGGDASELLAINREEFLSWQTAPESKVKEMMQHVNETLHTGFENLMHYIANDIAEEKNTKEHKQSKILEYIASKNSVCILLALVVYYINKKKLKKNENADETYLPLLVSDERLKYDFDQTFRFFVEWLSRNQDKHEIDAIQYDKYNRCLADSNKKMFTKDFLSNLNNTWFVPSLTILPLLNDDSGDTNENTDIVTVCEDLYAHTPLQLYWGDLFYIGNIKTRIIPVYQYCSTFVKAFNLKEQYLKMLYGSSAQYGEQQCIRYDNEIINNDNEMEDDIYNYNLKLFGERHVFPALMKYEILVVPYDPVICPPMLKNCGNVLMTPFTPKIFKDNVIRKIKDAIEEIHEKKFDLFIKSEEINKKIRQMFYLENENIKNDNEIIANYNNENINKNDLYGLRQLISYVHNKKGLIKPVQEYEYAYIEFIKDYVTK